MEDPGQELVNIEHWMPISTHLGEKKRHESDESATLINTAQ
jgi:hypothetical protein